MKILSGTWHWFFTGAHWTGHDGVSYRLLEHLLISAAAVVIAAAVALPIGLYLGHKGRGGVLAVNISGVGRAVPTFGILVVFAATSIGFGNRATVIAMVLFAIPPILTNAYVGMRQVDPDVKESARGMGMTERQLLRGVELPLALPLVAAGVRTAAVQVIATATLAAYVAGGGLGRFIDDGFANNDYPEVLAGAILVALLAIAVELLLGRLQRRLTPRGGDAPLRAA